MIETTTNSSGHCFDLINQDREQINGKRPYEIETGTSKWNNTGLEKPVTKHFPVIQCSSVLSVSRNQGENYGLMAFQEMQIVEEEIQTAGTQEPATRRR